MSHLSLREFRKSSIFRLGLAVILMFTFAVACGGGGEEEPTEEALEQPTEVVVEEPTEAPMEEATEAPVEEATEAPMEEATEAPAEEATEAPMEEATEAPMEEATEAPEVNTDVSGSLSILGFSLPDEVATVRVDRFKELYPNVEVNLTEGSLDQQQFLTAVASGNPPDLIYTNREVLSTYATRGALMPLDDCVSNMNVDMSQYRQPAVEQVTVEGTLYGIPEFYNIILVMIDGDVLDEAGLTVDDIDTSDWDQIAAVNEQMTQIEDGQLTRIGFDPKLPEFFPLWVHANGGQLISDDGRTAMLNSPEAVEALEFTAGLHEPAGGRQDFIAFRDTWDFFGGNNMFVADQLGAFPMEQWYVNVLAEVSPDTNVSFKPFTDRQGNPLSFATGNTWAIPAGSTNPEAACAFAVTMTEPDAWIAAEKERLRLREESGQPPAGVYSGNVLADDVIFGELLQTTGSEQFDQALDVILEVQDNAFSTPGNPAGAEFRQAWIDAVNRVLNGEQTAEEALNQAQDEAQAALDEGWAE